MNITPESPIIAIDPGYTESGFLVWDPVGKSILEKGLFTHQTMVEYLRASVFSWLLAIEMFQSYGMSVGKEVFQTCVWIGHFEEAWGSKNRPYRQVFRPHIKTHHCGTTKATDSNIRQALIDKYGPIGSRKLPGPLYDVTKHEWSALAIATFVAETTPRGNS